MKEEKKNEIREIFKSLNLQVNKLKRLSFGPFTLDKIKPGEIRKVSNYEMKKYSIG